MKKVGTWFAVAIIIVGLVAVGSLFVKGDTERTDDAQVDQYVSPVNVRVAGYVREIRFTEHQWVRQGDTLLVIDDREYRIHLKQAEAALLEARGGKQVASISVGTLTENAEVLDANIAEEELRAAKLQADYDRYLALLEKKATTPVVVEQYKANLDMSRARIEALKSRRRAARSTVSEAGQRNENADATVLRSEAAVDMARLNLSYTVVTAPCDGYTGRRNLEVGQLVSPGMAITTLIPSSAKWITANFKETQMSRIREGQQVEIEIDALPGKTFEGRVQAISSATGSKYSLMPTDNSTGNFVKIQQRVPVKISIDNATDDENRRMAAGMMCEVAVKVKNEE